MGLKYLFTATLLLFLVLTITCSGYTTHYIKPTPDTTCPAEPCLTLSEYAHQPHQYITSNTKLLLLPGVHFLSINFIVENIRNFEICNYVRLLTNSDNHPNSTVVCKGLVGIVFRNISSMILDGLTFKSCGSGTYGMSIVSGEDIMFINCSFRDSVGTALWVFDSSLHLHGNRFTNNGRSSWIHERLGTGIFTNTSTLLIKVGKSAIYGGGITSMNSNLNFTDNIAFTNNSAKYGGGIYASNSTLNFKGHTIFEENSAEYGGGIKALNSTLKLTSNCTFKDNIAKQYGGGINLYGNSTLISTGYSTFRDNLARYFGGGLNTDYSTLIFTGNTTFRGNSAEYGGGIRAGKSTLNLTDSSSFTENIAEQYGGGICAVNSTLISSGNNAFGDNSARYFGGGINAVVSNLNFTGNITFRSNSAEYGGGIYAHNSTMNMVGNSSFRGNAAEQNGGRVYVWNSTPISTGSSTFRDDSFLDRHPYFGGGIKAVYSTLNFTGNITFIGNSAEYGGGISVRKSALNLTGNSIFTGNTAEHNGGGIYIQNSTLISTGNRTFRDNSAQHFGGGICAADSNLMFTGNNVFRSNSAIKDGGGGMMIFCSNLNFIENTTFINNSAKRGGGIRTFYSTLTITGKAAFRKDTAKYRGGSTYTILNIVGYSEDSNSGKYHENCTTSCSLLFIHNSAEFFGGAVDTVDSTLNFEGCNTFSRNSAWYYGGGVHSENSILKISGNTIFSSNSVQYNGGGIYGLGTTLYMSGMNNFTANTAERGGAEYLASSFILLSKNSTVTMNNNSAIQYGGAVFVQDSNPITYCTKSPTFSKCFIDIFENPQVMSNVSHEVPDFNIHLYFYNNHARITGNAMYGGSLDVCHISVHYKYANSQRGYKYFKLHEILNMELEPNSVSSDPFQVCLCIDGTPCCNTLEESRKVYPGELLRIPVVAVGQNNGVVPAVIRAYTHGNTSLAQLQYTQEVKKKCTELYYQVHSSTVNNSDILVLYADGPCSTAGKLLNISLHFLPCPPGFSLNSNDSTCGCEPRLQKYTTRCNITERTLTREGTFWVGYDNYTDKIILHPHCPFDYCKHAKDHIRFPLNNTDLQCENNRSGILCGECKSGLSLAFGSSKCLKCTNLHQLLLIPFALAGIALILLLFICKLTVAVGTINGLIFYANIVSVNRAIFFPPNQTNILTVFISWVNLDFGFEACFFDGMDEYSKTWLQFIFPLYVWSLVALIIIASEYSSRISWLFGSNPVAVLATLFLLSYGKLLRTVITAMFFTTLDYFNEVKIAVWLCDGNIQYLHGKHIALFLAALLTFLIFLLPYTLLLTVGQWLQANSNRRVFHWINKPWIKPFLDAYQAPFRDQHRYWTGLLLCLRCVLSLVFAYNTQADPSINLLAISSVAFGLVVVTRYTGAVYRKLHVDVLETSFLVNLGILAIATYYVKLAVVPANQAVVISTSVGVALATSTGVVLYHTYLQVWPKLQQRVHCFCAFVESKSSIDSSEEKGNEYNDTSTLVTPTTTIIDPPHPEQPDLINIDDSSSGKYHPLITPYANFIELREPLELINDDDP